MEFVNAKNKKLYSRFKTNFRIWNICKELSIQNATGLYYKACPIFPIRLIKTVRMRVRETEALLKDATLEKTLKIVVLVRDPRGIINSRRAMPFCRESSTIVNKNCNDTSIACEDLQDNVLAAHELEKRYLGWFYSNQYQN